VLIHGCCLTGKSWESTPDGRMGWDEYFVRRGFPTYVIDQSGRGRSAVNATAINAAKIGEENPEQLPTYLLQATSLHGQFFVLVATTPRSTKA